MPRIHVGSQNQTKVTAARNVLLKSDLFTGAQVEGVDVSPDEFGHPKTIEETIKGAKDRAHAAFDGSDLGVGLEAELIEAPETRTGYLETTICALYDGKAFAIGSSPSFEWPPEVVRLILDGLDGSQAFKEVGLTTEEKLGTTVGAIYTLTHGKVTRTKLNELAITMALVQLENSEQYSHK